MFLAKLGMVYVHTPHIDRNYSSQGEPGWQMNTAPTIADMFKPNKWYCCEDETPYPSGSAAASLHMSYPVISNVRYSVRSNMLGADPPRCLVYTLTTRTNMGQL